MKILREGTAHMKWAWFSTCECCESELRIIEGDPQAGETCYNYDASQYYIRWICPVCKHRNISYTGSSFGKRANAEYKEIILVEEDRKEMENWGIQMDVIENTDDIAFLLDRSRV